nr:hypothetical protein [Tanacetum cinerariifolium]
GEGSTVPVESHHTPSGAPTTSQPLLSSPHRSFIRQETEVPQLSSPTHIHVVDEAASTCVDVRHGEAVTTFGGGVIDLTGDEDPTDEDGDTGMDDSTGVLASLGDEIPSRTKNS